MFATGTRADGASRIYQFRVCNRDWTDIAGDYMFRLMWDANRNISSMFATGIRADGASRIYQSV